MALNGYTIKTPKSDGSGGGKSVVSTDGSVAVAESASSYDLSRKLVIQSEDGSVIPTAVSDTTPGEQKINLKAVPTFRQISCGNGVASLNYIGYIILMQITIPNDDEHYIATILANGATASSYTGKDWAMYHLNFSRHNGKIDQSELSVLKRFGNGTDLFYSIGTGTNESTIYICANIVHAGDGIVYTYLSETLRGNISVTYGDAHTTYQGTFTQAESIDINSAGDGIDITNQIISTNKNVPASIPIEPFEYLQADTTGTFTSTTTPIADAISCLTSGSITASNIELFITQGGAYNLIFAIYSVARVGTTNTYTLLTQTASHSVTTTTTGLINVPFITPVTLSANTMYYIAYGVTGNGVLFCGKALNVVLNNIHPLILSSPNCFNTDTSFKTNFPEDKVSSSPHFVPWFKIY